MEDRRCWNLKRAGITVEIIRAFDDGDYVVLQNQYNLFRAGEQVRVDIFRFEDDLIVEH